MVEIALNNLYQRLKQTTILDAQTVYLLMLCSHFLVSVLLVFVIMDILL